MARIGISYAEVKHAAIKLLSQGNAPSVQKVRDLLGTGSNTTIAEHLKTWREDYAKKQVHHLPANMPKELISAIEVLWQTAMEQAENQLAAVKQDINDQQEKVQQEKLANEQAVTELKSQISTLNQQLTQQTQDYQALQTDLALTQERLTKNADELIVTKKQYESRLKRVFDEKNTTVEKVEQLQAAITNLQEQLTVQVKQHQAAITQERTLQAQSEQRWLNLIDQARLETKNLRKNHENTIDKQAKQIESVQKTVAEYQNKTIEQQAELAHKNQAITELNERLEHMQAHCTKATATIAVLESNLALSKKKKSAKKQAALA